MLFKMLPYSLKEKSYECHICSKVFSNAIGLNIHFRSHFNQKCCICNICSQVFSEQCHLSKHLLSHKDVVLFTCDKCDKVFPHQVALNVHRQTHVKKESLCDISMSEKDFLDDNEIENTDCILVSHQPQYNEKYSDCAFSQNKESFENDMLLKKTLQSNVFQNNEGSLECYETQDVKKHLIQSVPQSTDVAYDLPQESFSENKSQNSNLSQKKTHLCSICRTECFTQDGLDDHCYRPGYKKKFICDKCHAEFYQKTHLYSHLHLQKGFSCKLCLKKFSNGLKYAYHIKTHVKPYKCIVCEKGFAHKKNLNDHLRTHTDEKPFECEECPAKFSQKSHLNRHLKLHKELLFTFHKKSDQ